MSRIEVESLDTLPWPWTDIKRRERDTVTIAADPDDVTEKFGAHDGEFIGSTGRFLYWTHPAGFQLEVFVPADVS